VKELVKGCGLSGRAATVFASSRNIASIIITEKAELALFQLVYPRYMATAKRICSKKLVEAKYGKCNWATMDVKIQDLIADLVYRGDYRLDTRELIQRTLVSGSKKDVLKALDLLKNVPTDRKRRRIQHLN